MSARLQGLSNRRGAVYFPADALNIYQTWWRYDAQQVRRDLDVAAALNVSTRFGSFFRMSSGERRRRRVGWEPVSDAPG